MAQTAKKHREANNTDASGCTSHGTFCWNELMTRDVKRAQKFYEETIGWTFSPMAMADGRTYWCAMLGDKPVAGMFPLDKPEFDGVPENWMSYLAVDDVDKRQIAGTVLESGIVEAAFGMSDDSDKYVAGLYTQTITANRVNSGTAVAVTTAVAKAV